MNLLCISTHVKACKCTCLSLDVHRELSVVATVHSVHVACLQGQTALHYATAAGSEAKLHIVHKQDYLPAIQDPEASF